MTSPETSTCIHCKEAFTPANPAYRASCSHRFHMQCQIRDFQALLDRKRSWACTECEMPMKEFSRCDAPSDSPTQRIFTVCSHYLACPQQKSVCDCWARNVFLSLDDLVKFLPELVGIVEDPEDVSLYDYDIYAQPSGCNIDDLEGYLLDLSLIMPLAVRIACDLTDTLPEDAPDEERKAAFWNELLPTVRSLLFCLAQSNQLGQSQKSSNDVLM